MLIIHKPKCENIDIVTIRTSLETQNLWKNHFQKNCLCFRIQADFEADIDIDNSSIGNKTTNLYKQNPIRNGYHIESEMEDVLKSECLKSFSGYDHVDWFVEEAVELERRTFPLKMLK